MSSHAQAGPRFGPQLVRLPEMAAQLSMSERSVRRLADRGIIPSIRPTKRLLLFDPPEVVAALKRGRG